MTKLSRNRTIARLVLFALALACATPMFAQGSPLGDFTNRVAADLQALSVPLCLIIIIVGAAYLGFSDGRGKGAVVTAMVAAAIILTAPRWVGWLGV